MRDAMHVLNEDLLLKIGIHEGPCLAVNLNDRQLFWPDREYCLSRARARHITVNPGLGRW